MGVGDVIKASPANINRSFPETYDLQNLYEYLSGNNSRELNVAVMLSFFHRVQQAIAVESSEGEA